MDPYDLVIVLRVTTLPIIWPSCRLVAGSTKLLQALRVFLFQRGPLLQKARELLSSILSEEVE